MNISSKLSLGAKLVLLSWATLGASVAAQPLPDSTATKVDQLFSKWNNKDSPGCVVGVVKGDRLVYAKGFGLANLENGEVNDPSSIFYMCSLSKQFTGYAVALLAGAGKVDLDADIHKYLPWMSDFGGRRITVRHLLNHTSGLRDDIGLSRFFGLGSEGMLTQEMALRIIKKQQTLNFDPGEKFSYSNSNYVLLAEIVKKTSGKSFRKYVDSVIFKPLGMSSSAFIDDHGEVIKNRVASYEKDGKFYRNANQNVYTLGDGGLFTNIPDMAKWVSNFYQPIAGTSRDIGLMTTPGKLGNGKPISYAMGIDAGMHRGHTRYIHNGGLAGYRTVIAVYPELKTGFLVFGNGGDQQIYDKVNQLAELFIADRSLKENKAAASSDKVFELKDSTEIKKWVGTYLATNGYKVDITYSAGKLYANNTALLAPDAPDQFHMAVRPSVKYKFTLNPKTREAKASLISPVLTKNIVMSRIPDTPVSLATLKAYEGTYVSEEVGYAFTIEARGNNLYMNSKATDPVKIVFAGPDHLFMESGLLNHVLVKRDKAGRITGVEYASGDTSGMIFKKT